MKTDISIEYSTHSISIVLHLLHNNEDYNKLWIKKFPKTKAQASNFFKNENCGLILTGKTSWGPLPTGTKKRSLRF